MTAVLLLTAALGVVRAEPGKEGEMADTLTRAPSRYAVLDGLRIHYKDIGTGETALVFVHGWTCDLTFWRLQVPAYQGRIRMIFIDLPGHGRSDKPEIEYGMDLFARATDAVLRSARITSAVLIGHSMGALVARQYYRRYPDKTRALVVVDQRLRPFSTRQEDLDRMIRPFAGPDYQTQVGGLVDGMFGKNAPAELKQQARVVMQATPQHVVVSALKGMLDPAIYKDDPIKVGLLMVLARKPIWNEDYEKFVRQLAPQVDYHIVDDTGHFIMLERPAALTDLLTPFLRQQGILKPE
jgi:pimeloyl-ACP methyl ester carboxylesterase